ncbi:hypothetical protein SAMN02745781_03881 [Vibrio gazogenes DSM 21264]|uniref:Uncharacterized protein n=1 Tax=Vibrio gazogenes DSM 21264 = NBRC 103151 TaxID=1123492 RepID=A0A1M5GR71_VIBGA|nr:hypothetical protein SAMN02745781_03881 [Vibrio gazogenes DSM 21264] [Vibrio gazogenes DSM 21264 = NBRC 103151]SJN53293.1 hypothetical protein BQ6471_00369 [Vibrio gazogenes]
MVGHKLQFGPQNIPRDLLLWKTSLAISVNKVNKSQQTTTNNQLVLFVVVFSSLIPVGAFGTVPSDEATVFLQASPEAPYTS